MSRLKDIQAEIALRMRRGHTFASIESEIIDLGDFSEEEKAALWLYGWSFVPTAYQRTEANAHIDRLATRPRRGGRRHRRPPAVACLFTG